MYVNWDFHFATEFSSPLALVQCVVHFNPKPILNILNSVLNLNADAVTNGIVSTHGEVLGRFLPPEG